MIKTDTIQQDNINIRNKEIYKKTTAILTANNVEIIKHPNKKKIFSLYSVARNYYNQRHN